jgi:hypothetical protein
MNVHVKVFRLFCCQNNPLSLTHILFISRFDFGKSNLLTESEVQPALLKSGFDPHTELRLTL